MIVILVQYVYVHGLQINWLCSESCSECIAAMVAIITNVVAVFKMGCARNNQSECVDVIECVGNDYDDEDE